MKITRSELAKLPPPGNQRRTFWDDDVQGFGVTQQVSGRVSFVAKYRVAGRQVMKKLGDYPAFTPEQARQIFAEYKANAVLGVDLAAKIRDERRAQETINDLCDLYETTHLPRKRPASQDEDQRKIRNIIRPKLGSRKIVDITRSEIAAIHSAMSKTPVEANRLLALLSKMFSIAVVEGRRSDNPVRGIEKYLEQPRQRYLSADEHERLKAALEVAEGDHFETVILIRLLMTTGARKSEVIKASWDQFDLRSGVWTKPASVTKQKKVHRVPLAQSALMLLQELQGRIPPARPTNPLFSLSIEGRKTALKRLWPELCKNAQLGDDLHVHDLRHSFAATVLGGGSSLPMVGALLGHTQASTTKRYEHLADAVLRDALKAIDR